jgi:hypothetical protein
METTDLSAALAKLELDERSVVFCDPSVIDLVALSKIESAQPGGLFVPAYVQPGQTVADCVHESELVNQIVWYMGLMKNFEDDCGKRAGEFCAQCKERRSLRRELADLLMAHTPLTEEALKDVL